MNKWRSESSPTGEQESTVREKAKVRKGKKALPTQVHEVKKKPPGRRLTKRELDEFDRYFNSQIDEEYKP